MTVLYILTVLFVLVSLSATLASLLKWDYWWIRIFDFPRLQVSFITLGAIVLVLIALDFRDEWQLVILGLLLFSLVYQLIKIYPYTFLAKKQVKSFKGEDDENLLSLLVSNVFTPNQQYQKLIDLVSKEKPDVLLALETDSRWEEALEPLEKTYQYTVKVPKDNFYGMHLYSKLELRDMKVMYLVDEEIPSIHGTVILGSGAEIKIHCLHPMPPSPTENEKSTDRDAELLIVGKNVDTDEGPELVFGDLNDVAWSRTTRLFQKTSCLLDPRIGRGFFNTFHAGYMLFRWPLDHIFHSNDFTLKTIKRLGKIGSDHFPIFLTLHYEPRAKQAQEQPEADAEEEEWADEKIEKAHPKKVNTD